MTDATKPTHDELRARAAEVGLTRLRPEHLDELARGLADLKRQASARRADMRLSDEPAHVFRASPEA
ncbi:MAG: hypothetical protein EXQ87_01320 [Alphaproteobacteria bacterium]|nr:hypothetical protein [Alphaproteobacteria bacterium]